MTRRMVAMASLASLSMALALAPAVAQDRAGARDSAQREGARGRQEQAAPADEAASAAEAQAAAAPTAEARSTAGDGADTAARADTAGRDRILRAIRLPRTADEARESGVEEADVAEVMEAARRHRLPAQDTAVILEEGSQAAREGGRVENFGAFVQRSLDEGLRGRDLAAAIHAEKAAAGQAPEKSKGKKSKGKR